jgi:hypothetical protein
VRGFIGTLDFVSKQERDVGKGEFATNRQGSNWA